MNITARSRRGGTGITPGYVLVLLIAVGVLLAAVVLLSSRHHDGWSGAMTPPTAARGA